MLPGFDLQYLEMSQTMPSVRVSNFVVNNCPLAKLICVMDMVYMYEPKEEHVTIWLAYEPSITTNEEDNSIIITLSLHERTLSTTEASVHRCISPQVTSSSCGQKSGLWREKVLHWCLCCREEVPARKKKKFLLDLLRLVLPWLRNMFHAFWDWNLYSMILVHLVTLVSLILLSSLSTIVSLILYSHRYILYCLPYLG
jgi:hypothetical protein